MIPLYDVIIIGGGPAGATAAYFLAQSGKRVALLDKARFPRDKRCGDAWCAPALELLEEMGVLQVLEAKGAVQWVRSGGLVSPSGLSFVSPDEGPREGAPRVAAIRRMLCDEQIVRAAEGQGAELFEDASVRECTFHDQWTVRCKDARVFRGRSLIAADGAKSSIARSLGLVKTGTNSAASRQYIKGGTHRFTSDGVLLYPKYVIPGYVALFRHSNDDIDVGCYVLPGGRTPPNQLKAMLATQVSQDPFVREALGDHAEPLEPPGISPIRVGGEPRTFAEALLVVGDAAGQTDPLTGEGIHTAMVASKIAAHVLSGALDAGDLSEARMAEYQRRWVRAFGREFAVSAAAGRLISRYPALLDTAAIAAQKEGARFMDEFGAAMTGVKSKAIFLAPRMSVPLAIALAKLGFGRGRADYAAGPAREPRGSFTFRENAVGVR
jgi:geranylgeranyl reductase family protein